MRQKIYFLVSSQMITSGMIATGPTSAAFSSDTPDRQVSTRPASPLDILVQRIGPAAAGWTVTTDDHDVILERSDPVEVYNGIGLPALPRDKLMNFVRPNVHRMKFRIGLRIGEWLSNKQYEERAAANDLATRRAAEFLNGAPQPRKISMNDFLRQHPEYGFRQLPDFDGDTFSVYVSVSIPEEFEFVSDEVHRECSGVLDRTGRLFRPYRRNVSPTTSNAG